MAFLQIKRLSQFSHQFCLIADADICSDIDTATANNGVIESMNRDIDVATDLKRYDELLRSNNVGLLSTIRKKDGLISTNPVGFVWDGESIRISTLKSRLKYENIVANPMATFCVMSRHNLLCYLEVRGYATLLDDLDRSFSRRQFMESSGGQEPPADMDPPHAERVIIQLHPQQVSSPKLYGGRFDEMSEL